MRGRASARPRLSSTSLLRVAGDLRPRRLAVAVRIVGRLPATDVAEEDRSERHPDLALQMLAQRIEIRAQRRRGALVDAGDDLRVELVVAGQRERLVIRRIES